MDPTESTGGLTSIFRKGALGMLGAMEVPAVPDPLTVLIRYHERGGFTQWTGSTVRTREHWNESLC